MSQLANVLEATIYRLETQPECDAIIVYGSRLVNSLIPNISKTFEGYAVQYVVPKIQAYSSNYAPKDISFNAYWT